MTITPEEAEGITANHFTAFELGLARAKGWVGVEPTGKASLSAAIGARAEPSQRDRLEDAEVAVAPIQLKALLLAENPNRYGSPLCLVLHRGILGFARKRQMSGHESVGERV